MEAGEPRGKFADTAHFETVYTNNKGEATVKFKLPDNVTTYRVTAHSANEDMYVGVNKIDITSKLDFFIQVTEPRNVKTTDDLVLNATCISDEIYDVDYEFTIKELDKTLTTRGSTNKIATANFGKLEYGTYHAVIRGKYGNEEDAIEYEFNVIEAAQEVKDKIKFNINNENQEISPTKNPICLEIYNKNMDPYIRYIEFVENTYSIRLDTKIAYNKITNIKNKYYEKENTINDINLEEYRARNNCFRILPASQEDLLLTALVGKYAKDIYSSCNYEFDIKNILKEDTNLFEAYLIAASQNEPILNDLMYLKEDPTINTYNKLLLTLSFEFLGDYQNAKDIYYSTNLKSKELEEYKSIIAIIETFFNKNDAIEKIDQLIKENPSDKYVRFAILSFFENNTEELDKEEQVTIKCGNINETIVIKGMQIKKYSISNNDLEKITFETNSENLIVSYYYQTLLENVEKQNILKDMNISINGDLTKSNTVNLEIDFHTSDSCDIRIALPNSLRLASQKNEFDHPYYIMSNNIDYTEIHKNNGYSHLSIPLFVVYEGEYKFESVVVQEENIYHISNSLDLNIN